ncbi:MAG: hypothetical protein ACYDCJ_06885 [Gammaproteobacteria bacterium]
MYRRIVLLVAVSISGLMLVSCGGGSSGTNSQPPPNPAPSGTLTVTITGLSSGINANVVVTGPGSFSQNLTQTTTLTGLTTGTYSVAAAVVASSQSAVNVFVPSVSGNPTTVSVNATATAGVNYQSLPTEWTAIGPLAIQGVNGAPAGAGKLQAFAIDNQNPSIMFAGGGIGPGNSGPYTEAGIYKTTNGGTTWTQADVGLTDPTVNVLWLDQSNPSTILAGTNTAGIFQSTDDGAHWTVTATLGTTTAIIQSAGSLYAATAQGIAVSTNSGSTWTVTEPTPAPVLALASEGDVIYAGLDNDDVLVQSSPTSAWITTTLPTQSGSIWSIAINPTNPQNAFVVEFNNYQSPDLLYTTNDAGSHWTVVTSISCPAQYVAFNSSGSLLYAGCDGPMYQSSDDGKTWSSVPELIRDVRLIIPDVGGVVGNLLVGTDQGLDERPAGSSTWQSLNGNITSSILYGLGVSGSTILTTAQDYSPINSYNAGVSWSVLAGSAPEVGEDGSVLFNPGNVQYVYEFTTGGFQYSTNGGQTFQLAQSLPANKFNQSSGNGDLIAVDPNNPSTVYVASVDGVYKSADWGVTWTLQSWPVTTPVMVAVEPTNSETVFVGTLGNPGQLLITHDGGTTWAPSNLGGACGSPTSLTVDPADPQIILLAMSGSLPCGGIQRSTDGGADFAPANNGIVPRQVLCENAAFAHIKFDPSGSGLVVTASPSGLYLSSDLGLDWTNIRGNSVPQYFTQAVWSGGYLYASTCGEGVLRLPFTL